MYDINAKHPKTKRRLRRSFLHLLEETPYTKFNVKDIILEPGLSRQTFYLYYRDKEALLDEIITDLANGLIHILSRTNAVEPELVLEWLTDPYSPIFLQCFKYMRAHSEEFLIFLKSNNETDFLARFCKIISVYQEENYEFQKTIYPSTIENEVRSVYITALHELVNTLIQWVYDGMMPEETIMATQQTRMWLSYFLLFKDDEPNSIYSRLVEKMQQKGLQLEEWIKE